MVPDVSWYDFERAGWELHAEPYHQFFGPLCVQLADPLLDAVVCGRRTRLLDACCGPGYMAGRAAERGAAAEGFDIATAMVELAACLHPAARFQVADAENVPYADHTFDAVVCSIGVHHLSTPGRGVAEFARVLRPGGRLALSTWDEERSALGAVAEAVMSAATIDDDLPAPPAEPGKGELEALVRAAGLTVEAVETVALLQRYASIQALWDGWLAAAIRTGPLLAAQPRAAQQAARRALDGLVAPYLGPDGAVDLPVGVTITTATRSRA